MRDTYLTFTKDGFVDQIKVIVFGGSGNVDLHRFMPVLMGYRMGDLLINIEAPRSSICCSMGSQCERMRAMRRLAILAALLVASTGWPDNVVAADDGPVALQPVGPPLGDEPVLMIRHDGASLPTGTFIAQDKSKGVTWLFDLAHGRVRAIELPFNNGNHETAVNVDGTSLVSPHYETLGPGNDEGGGFYPVTPVRRLSPPL